MLNHVEMIFNDMQAMMKKLKKLTYENNMEKFREQNNHFFMEMMDYVEQHEDKVEASKEIAETFTDTIKAKFSKNGKVKGRTQADLNFFMIYYVFPALLLIKNENADMVASSICGEWRSKFKNSNIGYADYDKIHDSFRSKIFGIF